jgi:GTP cyclohydrolase I
MEEVKQAIKTILKHIGEDVSRKELLKTPDRMLESYKEIFSGYAEKSGNIIGNTFSEVETDEIIVFENIDFFSTCEHHFAPFFGQISIAYIPSKQAVGFGRITNLIKAVTRTLQIQERIAFEIGTLLQKSLLNPTGVFVKVEGRHFCNISVEKTSKPLVLKTIFTTGEFKKPENIEKLKLLIG